MKLTRHNGRSGKNGVYNPKHNDRRFDLENSDHIDAERSKRNIYWDWLNGYRRFSKSEAQVELRDTFADVEKQYYSIYYGDFVKGQNARNEKNRHTERNRTTDDILKDKHTCPEETVYQIGTMDEHVTADVLQRVMEEYIAECKRRFGEHIHILDWALHDDEATPHIHERHVFDCENRYGEVCPQQEKALEALGFELPEPDKKKGRFNNRKMVYDSACRVLLFDIAEQHGLHLDREPEYGGRKYLEKQDYILAKQKEQIAAGDNTLKRQQEVISQQAQMVRSQRSEMYRNDEAIRTQEQHLDELVMKIDDVEVLIDDVSRIAYDKAVEVVTDAARAETQKEDMKIISDYRDWLLKPERKAPKGKREFAAKILDSVIDKIRTAAQKLLAKVTQSLMKPEAREAGVEAVKGKARESVLTRLGQKKVESAQLEEQRRQQRSSQCPTRSGMEH